MSRTNLADYSLDELSQELRRRGWKLLPTNFASAIVGGLSTGFWPSNLSVGEHDDG